ncbi:hypothetical protein ARMSODRAFT_986674 [Armillaria solidipes]|uniref:CxC2-like cysteine cluster KDZ transposase-associated domain-containing protein n=1 Tax=Armillaria solidipes TaxID=1076256 RepID=A0A2H3CEK1_9AGAR|nr:hypothetical protein ARMSODRAFT_986674 [Armillaria solidipes]
MKGRSRVYRADNSTIWNDRTISHSCRVKVGRGSSVLQYAGGPSTRCTQRVTFVILDSHIPQEVLYDQNFPIQEPAESKKAPPKRYINSEWNGEQFTKTTLRELGLRVQIRHFDGSECICPERVGWTFTVLDINGIHEVDVDYCSCDRREGATHRQQLLRFGWYPMTPLHPRTCATLTLLDQFHTLMHAGKVSAYNYYHYLNTMTDAWGIRLPRRKYTSLLRMVRQYRHLKMMMRAGRGQEENGIVTTSEGQLALRCPACPMPEVNLPEGWRSAGRSIRSHSFLYRGIFAMDTNFRLENLYRSTVAADPGLHTGLAYFVTYAPYAKHLAKYVTQKDISTCSGFKTLEQAETKGETGLWATGVAMCVCTRHEMVCAMGMGDLQKGERYTNMDYIIMSSTTSLGLQNIFVSYDIISNLHLRGGVGLSCGVPKLHTKAHKLPCQCEYAIGIQDGTRHDTLDDHFAYHNFIKMIGLGNMLHRWLTEAEIQVEAHRKYHADFTNALPKPEYKTEWMAVVEEWDCDGSKPTPYLSVDMSEQELKLKLKEDECRAKARGDIPIHKISATSCLALGLLIEDSQRRISAIVSREGELSSSELADVEMRRTNLSKQIEQFRELQVVYMPGITLQIEREREAAMGTIEAEDDKLWFPSDLSKKVCTAIRSSLRAEASLHDFRNANLRGQEALMHASDVLEAWKKKWELAAKKYQQARSAVLTLRRAGPWTYKLRELTAKDMSSMYGSVLNTEETATEAITADDQRQQKKLKTNRKDMPKEVSWIWSRAQLKRWEEEVALLREEQRRVLVTLRYRAKWWDSRRTQQCDAQLVLASNFASKWPSQYVPPPDDECDSDNDTL